MKKFTFVFIVMMFCSGGSICNNLFAVWQRANGIPDNLLVFAIISKGDVMIAGTSGGNFTTGDIYRSTDGGNNWAVVTTPVSNLSGIFSLAIKDNYIFAGTYEDGLLKSTDDGVTWVQDMVTGSQFTGVFRLGVSGNNLITYTNTGTGYYLTSNNGASWVTYPFTGSVIASYYSTLSAIYAASSKGLYTSTNNGFNWAQGLNNGIPANPDGSKRLAAITSLNNKLFVSTNQPVNSIYSSTDGNNWAQTSITLSQFAFVSSMRVSGNKIFASVRCLTSSPDYGVLVTTNEGASWSAVNEGFPVGTSVFDIYIRENKIFAGTQTRGIWSSDISTLTSIAEEPPTENAEGYSLSQNYPNPFNPFTNFEFEVGDYGFVSLKIYNSEGKEISTLVNKSLKAGKHNVSFNGAGLASGIYFYKLEAGEFKRTKRMVLMK